MDNKRELRMYLVWRNDLAIPFGKALGQSGHAFVSAVIIADRHDRDLVDLYLLHSQPKIVVKCKNLDALLRAKTECDAIEMNCYLVTDAGRTVFPEPTVTCLAIGPCYRDELPKFIRRMQLLD
jgi:PTH2 family peptidyl-tRNA hydrolase